MRFIQNLSALPFLLLLLLAFTACASKKEANSTQINFTDLQVVNIQSVSATIKFSSQTQTRCEIHFGTMADKLDQTATNSDMNDINFYSLQHDVVLEGLAPDTLYYYQAKVTDKDGNEYLSEIKQFSTINSPVSTGLVNIALPEKGTLVSDVSSNFGLGGLTSTYGGNKAVDGSLATEWSTNGDGDKASLSLDFGQSRQIVAVGFKSRKMMDGTSIITSFKLIFNANTILGPYQTPDPELFYQFDFDMAVTATSVKFQAVTTTGGNTGAKEIQFFIK